jgi:hypothetical protein
MVLIANHQASEVLKPGEQPFDHSSTLVTTKLPAVLSPVPAPLPAVRGNQTYAALIQKALIEPIAVIGLETFA